MPELDSDVQARLDSARETQDTYTPNADVTAQLGDRALVMLVGPAAVGKSFIMNEMIKLDKDFRRVPIFSTRTPRPDDEPSMFRCFPHDNDSVTMLMDEIQQGNVVQYAIHPTQGTIYGTLPGDYPGKFNLLATLSGVVETMSKLPFEETHVIGLATPGETWKRWFNERYPSGHPERIKRIDEAIISLEWMLDGTHEDLVTWIKNEPGRVTQTARHIIDIIKHGQSSDSSASRIARDMLASAYELRRSL